MTVVAPKTIVPPCAVISPTLAAGLLLIMTVAEPLTIVSDAPTQTQLSPTSAAVKFSISTVGAPGPVTGPPTCGIGGIAGVCIGQVCMSVNLAAGGIASYSLVLVAVLDRFRCLLIEVQSLTSDISETDAAN